MLKEFLKPDKRKLAIFLLLIVLLVPVSIIGSAAMEKAGGPSSDQPVLESLEGTLGPLGQFIIGVCGIIYLFVIIAPIFFFAFITQSSSLGFVAGIAIVALLLYFVACLLNAAFLLMAKKASRSQGSLG